MISVDTNLLLYAYSTRAPEHIAACTFLTGLNSRDDVALSEFILAELYLHLRNPAVLARPLSAFQAVSVIDAYRRHPRWRILGYPPDSLDAHNKLWSIAAQPGFARRSLFDARTAIALLRQGVTEFATCNIKDFQALGFVRVWNPLHER